MWTGDNLDIMRGMNSESVDLIYLDPPFNSKRNYAAPIGSQAAGAAFKDSWTLDDIDLAWHGEIADKQPALYSIIDASGLAHGKGMKSYLIMMAVRLMEIYRLLKPTGSLYLHCDPTASHYIKALMDAIFGPRQFRNEVVWKRTSSHNRAKRWGPIHDTILFYSAGPKFTWNRVLQPLDAAYVERFYRHRDGKGSYRVSDLTGPGLRDGDTGQPWRDIDPAPRSRHWELPPDHALPEWFTFPDGYADMPARERLDVLNKQGLIYWPAKQGGVPGFKRYLGAHSGSPVQDLILDIKPLSAAAMENVNYPTQKPLDLLDRIIKASSNDGDMVLDPFAGCATACVAAERLNRQWVGIDISHKAVELVQIRIRKEIDLFHNFTPIQRSAVPTRTDMGDIPNYRTHKHVLFGKQEGMCGGCRTLFQFRNFVVDHIIPKIKGGTDHLDNLQLLCNACNSVKGSNTQEYLVSKLKADGIL